MNTKLENYLTRKVKPLAGNFADTPEDKKLSEGAKELIEKAYEGVPERKLCDYHCHLISIGTGGNDGYVNHKMHNLLSFPHKLRFNFFASASGITDVSKTDSQYLERLIKLLRHIPSLGKVGLLAFDQYYDNSGNARPQITRLYVPNDYVMRVCENYPQYFTPVISVHPYRHDAIEELEKWAKQGVKFVKWLANTMNIDASDKRCIPFYETMKKYNMALLAHGGNEEALSIPGHQGLGNPLLYRLPLDMGLKVIIAHCAGLGKFKDLDKTIPTPVNGFELFFRMMSEPQYEGLLFGDLAAITQANRCGAPLKTILQKQKYHHRLINGSDYPLPSLNAAYSSLILQLFGYINKQEKKLLDEIYKANPLLCDFVTKRTIKHPKNPRIKFSPVIFGKNSVLSFFEEPISSLNNKS